MVLRISSKMHRELLNRAAASPGEEICGLILGVDTVDAIVATTNVAFDPGCSFEIDPAALFAAIRAERSGGARLLGYYHSHPSGPPMPSRRDTEIASPDGKIWIIIGEGRIKAWQIDQSKQFNEIALIVTD